MIIDDLQEVTIHTKTGNIGVRTIRETETTRDDGKILVTSVNFRDTIAKNDVVKLNTYVSQAYSDVIVGLWSGIPDAEQEIL